MPFDRKGYEEALERVLARKETFKIVRFRRNGASKVLQTGLTLDEARAHCTRPETSGDGWFDGYQLEGD